MKLKNLALREVLAVVGRLEKEPEHVLHVSRLALQLFDELEGWHGLGARARLLLEAAACLHDIGWSADHEGTRHHKHSARLIREQTWEHFDAEEVEWIALTARYHRKALPKASHRAFGALSKSRRRLVRTLAAILRVADGLDRRHLQIIETVRVRRVAETFVLELDAPRPVGMETAASAKKGDLLRELAGCDLRFEWTSASKARDGEPDRMAAPRRT